MWTIVHFIARYPRNCADYSCSAAASAACARRKSSFSRRTS
jgi:hypothetical protein